MDSSQRALLTNGKLFTNFKLVFELLPETEKIQTNGKVGILITVATMCYTSMDLSRQALQTNGKLFFFKLRNYFSN